MILLGLFSYIGSYVMNMVTPIVPGIKSIRLPTWLGLFFGNPRVKTSRPGVSFINMCYLLFGIYELVWGVVIIIFQLEPALFSFIGILSSILLGYLSSVWLYRKSPYIWEDEK